MECSPARGTEVLKTVYALGGSSILAGISHVRINHLLEQNDIAAATELATRLLEIAPDSSDAWHLYAQASNSAGNKQDAVRAALEAARLYAIAGAVMEEEDSYNEALEAAPGDPVALSAYAEFLIREHRPDEAVAQFQAIVRQAELESNVDAQIEALNRAVQIAPSNTDLREKLARILETIAPDSAIENWLHTAAAYYDAGEPDRARRAYQHILKLNPRNEIALQQLMTAAREDADLVLAASLTTRLAEVKAGRRNIGEACRILQAHLEIDPDNLKILEQLSSLAGASNDNEVFITTTRALARKFQKMGDSEAALRHYQALLDRDPRNGQLLTTILDCCAASGNSEAGLQYARQLLNIARETEDPERIRVAATTIINYEETDADARRELAESLLSLNRVQQAVAEFLRAAEFYESAGSKSNAFTCYRRATQISPSGTQAWRRLADLALTIGDMETARRSVSQLLETATAADAPRVTPLLDRLLQTTEDSHDVHEAALGFYRRTGDNSAAADHAVWLARSAAKSGDTDAAENLFSEALKLDPANREIKSTHYDFIRQVGRLEDLQLRLRHEADQHLTAGKLNDAITIYYELTAMAPGQVGVHRDLARLLEDAERHDESLVEYLSVIRLLLDRSELEEARQTAEDVVGRFPQAANARELVADVLVESAYPDLAARYYSTAAEAALLKKERERAIALLKKAVKARPLWAGARTALAKAYSEAGDKEAAFQASIELVSVLLENGEFLEATSTLNKLSEDHPESPQVREQLAGLYEKTGRRAEYIRVLRELGELYERAGDNIQAAAAYHRLSQADPDDAAAIARYVELATALGESDGKFADEYTRLAEVLARTGDTDGASQAYEQVLAQSPENTTARSRYAAFLLARGSRNRALTEMRTLAKLYLHRNEPAAAAEVLNAALTISPRDAELCLELAKAQESAGMVEDARVTYSRASAILANTAAVKGIDTYRRILSIDENNTAVRLRLVELLIKAGDTMEAAREARTLAEIHINRGELAEAEHAYGLVDECEPQSVTEIRQAIQRDSYDPSLQYLHYVRLGNCLFSLGDVDNALDAYRTARSLHDDQVELIQKCIDCLALIAPEAEAIPDYLVMAEKYLLAGNMQQARVAYNKVRMIDPFNNDARCGIESVNATENRQNAASGARLQDEVVLKTSRSVNKRVALMDLLVACQDAADEQSQDSGRLGMSKTKN
jgi:tetratricopeptide (TPR) repeat protein